jgi:endo-1,4-beta-xylanase
MLSRRHVLWRLSGWFHFSLFAMISRSPHPFLTASALATIPNDLKQVGDTPLRDRAAARSLNFGTFPTYYYRDFLEDSALQALVVEQCNLLVAGFYAGITRPDEYSFDFSATDGFQQFAADYGLLFRGHPLVWHMIHPQWLTDKLADPNAPESEIRQILVNHISTIVGRYAGKVHSWDVVNEAIGPHDGRSDGLQNTPWLQRLGADYIELAFRTAAAADGNARLVYNDNELEYDTPEHDRRRATTLNLLRDLKSKDVPLHALGIQAHLNDKERIFNPEKMRLFLQAVADLGLEIMLTEMDVTDSHLPADETERDRTVARTYEEFLNVVLAQPAVSSVITWGLGDRQSWLADFAPRPDGLLVRPLPYDANLNRKMAWYAIARAFDQAPGRDPWI